MSWEPWTIALSCSALCAALEAWLSGPRPFRVLAAFKQPDWGLPLWAWLAVGATFYIVMTWSAALMLEAGRPGLAPFALILAVMLTDGFWNYLLLRRRRIDLAYRYLIPYTALVAAATAWAFAVNAWAGLMLAVYLAFLPYDLAWTKALARLNPELARKPEAS